jgi:adenylate kinase
MNKKYLIFFGPPGSGKGTQVDILAAGLRLPVISPGELLRHEEEIRSKLGLKVRGLIDNGKMVPDQIIEHIIDLRLKRKDAKNGAVFDGYPRRMTQLRNLIKRLKRLAVPKDFVYAVYIHVRDSEVKKRITNRRVCDCGASYHLTINPPKAKNKCDLCGRKLKTRPDDKPKVVSDRLKDYHANIKPLVGYFNRHHELLNINGEQNIKKVQGDILKELKKRGVTS